MSYTSFIHRMVHFEQIRVKAICKGVKTFMDDVNNRFKVGVQDNGPGIVKKQIPLIFGKLL